MECPLSVWWDLDSCPPNHDTHPLLLANRMQSAFLQVGLPWGIQTFSAYGDASSFSSSLHQSLTDAAICLHHTPPGQTSIKGIMVMMVDMLTWALEHAVPANFVVITSKTELANPLHKLRMKCYNIVLICPLPDSKLSMSLTNAATVALEWPSLKLLPEAMELDNSMGGIVGRDNKTSAKRSSKEDEDAADIRLIESSKMEKVKKARIDDSQILSADNSRKRSDLCMLPSKTAREAQKVMMEERAGSREEPLLTNFKSCIRSKAGGRMMTGREVMAVVEPWLQCLVLTEEAACGIPILSLGERFQRDTGMQQNLQQLLGEELHIGLLQFNHIIRLERSGSTLLAFPATSCEGSPLRIKQLGTQEGQKVKLTKGSMKAIFGSWLQNFMATEEAACGISIALLGLRFWRETGIRTKLRNILGNKKVASGLLHFNHILRLERNSDGILVFPAISRE